jgi:preflagellin peptidase FlaK
VYVASLPDLLRLLAVPVFVWAAVRDVRTRRVPNATWLPVAGLGVALLGWEAWTLWTGTVSPLGQRLFLVHVAVSLGVVAPFAYLLWRIGGFGGADAKAFMALAILFPSYPSFYLAEAALPLVESRLGVFSLTVLSNTVLAGLAYPVVLALRNAVAGHRSWVALVGVRVSVADLPETHGRLLETPAGHTRDGLDLDALRMYLRWRDATLAGLRSNPDLRDPATLPDEPRDPTDGAVVTDGGADVADPWGAGAFLAAVDGDAYGTTPEQLRAGLDLLVERDVVWVTPGMPFLVPTVVGLLAALTVGDLLVVLLRFVGLV